MIRSFILICSLLLTMAADGVADDALSAHLETDGQARVVSVIDGDTVVLADGREVRLVGMQAPKLPLGRPNFTSWPLADQAKAALAELILGRMVTLKYGGRRLDRHGRLLAHLFDEGGEWIQGLMLENGLARVYTFADNRALASEMLSLEQSAREAGRGIWGNPFYAVRTSEQAAGDIGTFQLVADRVMDVAEVRGRTYVNFGDDWRD